MQRLEAVQITPAVPGTGSIPVSFRRAISNRAPKNGRIRVLDSARISQNANTANAKSPNLKARRIDGAICASTSNNNMNSVPTFNGNQDSAAAPVANHAENRHGIPSSGSPPDSARGPYIKRPSNFKRSNSKLSLRQEQGAKLWNQRWVKSRFPVLRGTLIDDITNTYLKLVEKVDTRITHNWHSRRISTHENFGSQMEIAREFEKKKEDRKCQKERLRRFPGQFQHDLERLNVPRDNVFILGDLALATTSSGWSRRLSIPRPSTVNGQRREPRDLASVICCMPYVGEPLMPAVTFKVERVEKTHDNFDGVPIFFTSDGWAEDFHLLDWMKLVFELASNPTGAAGVNAPRRLLLIDGYRFHITPEFFVTCWQQNIFCVCITRNGASYFNPFEQGVFRLIENLYAEWITDKVEGDQTELDHFKADPRDFASVIRDIMSRPVVKDQVMTGWHQTCLFRSKNEQAIRKLIDAKTTPSPGAPRTPTRARLRSKREIHVQMAEVDLLSPGPSTQERSAASPHRPLIQDAADQEDFEDLQDFISEETDSQNEEYLPSQHEDAESVGEMPVLDHSQEYFDCSLDDFQVEEIEMTEKDAEGLSQTVEPTPRQPNEPAIAEEPEPMCLDNDESTLVNNRPPEQSVTGTSEAGYRCSSSLSEMSNHTLGWKEIQTERMMKRVRDLMDATSPTSKKICQRKVIDTYRDMSKAYSALARILTDQGSAATNNLQETHFLEQAASLDESENGQGQKDPDEELSRGHPQGSTTDLEKADSDGELKRKREERRERKKRRKQERREEQKSREEDERLQEEENIKKQEMARAEEELKEIQRLRKLKRSKHEEHGNEEREKEKKRNERQKGHREDSSKARSESQSKTGSPEPSPIGDSSTKSRKTKHREKRKSKDRGRSQIRD
ncbi:uncharacterized protein N7482_010530 [Penicillium canariense]|uniref:DDE-1 domain-containing protein n=1 Tax=Penicillium canariense TaxID=189055 RepID=A0A9W9HJZ0_9EURO|nr:uncharacterized protein N7482_010530 [Penicillium canariense]KAJ5151278.1 hypothetical protein N7482_010530 [Penicillium canariense]